MTRSGVECVLALRLTGRARGRENTSGEIETLAVNSLAQGCNRQFNGLVEQDAQSHTWE